MRRIVLDIIMKLNVLPIAWACAAVLASTTSRGAATNDLADLSLEQLMELSIDSVYGASRYEQRVTQAPASISIVTADDIRRFGYTTVEDVLRSVRGLYVTDDRNYTYLGVRGFHRPGDYNTRVLVLVDGHRINDNLYDSGSIGRDAMLDVELIDRVEVIRGPSSSMYGSSAFFAVINVVTKRGGQLGGAEVSQELASLDTNRTRAAYGNTFANGVDWLASASHYASNGVRRLYYPELDQRLSDDPRARNDGRAVGLDDEEASKFFTSVRYGNLSASAQYSERVKQIPTASFDAIFGDAANRSLDERGFIDIVWDGTLGEELRYRARGSYDHFTYDNWLAYDYALPGDPPDRVIYRDAAVGEWLGAELQLSGTLFERYAFVLGTEYRANLREDQLAYDELDPPYYYLTDRRSSDVVGTFAQIEATLRSDFRITAGLRYDHYNEGIGGTLNPRIAAIYNPSARSALKLLYGEAFRAPNPYERHYFFEVQRTMSPLEPETIRTYEIVYEHYLARHYHLNVSAYRYRVDRLITQAELDGEPYYANIDAARAHGFEIELEAKYDSGLLARASYILQRAKDETTGRELTNSPRQLAKLGVSVPTWGGKLFANVELQYYAEASTLAGATTPSFLLTDLSITTAKLWHGVELSAAIDNAFDAEHGVPGSAEHVQDTLQMNGRTYRGKVLVRF